MTLLERKWRRQIKRELLVAQGLTTKGMPRRRHRIVVRAGFVDRELRAYCGVCNRDLVKRTDTSGWRHEVSK